MISNRPTVPLLVHEDCMEGIQLDLAKQQASLSKISANTAATNTKLDGLAEQQETTQGILNGIATDVDQINTNTAAIKTSSANTATQLGTIKDDTGVLSSSVGLTSDQPTASTVIGLLKSIANKL